MGAGQRWGQRAGRPGGRGGGPRAGGLTRGRSSYHRSPQYAPGVWGAPSRRSSRAAWQPSRSCLQLGDVVATGPVRSWGLTGASWRGITSGAWPVTPVVGLEDVFVVRTVEAAEHAVEVLWRHVAAEPFGAHAWDTEVADMDIKQSPIDNGSLLCLSCYAGPAVDFGSGQRRLWVDCWERGGMSPAQYRQNKERPAVLEPFREYFASSDTRLVWHNYSFDAHVLENYGITTGGLAGDTMHMARLWDSSLGHDELFMTDAADDEHAAQDKAMRGYGLAPLSQRLLGSEHHKTSMKELFGRAKLKRDGTPGKVIELPPLKELQHGRSLSLEEWVAEAKGKAASAGRDWSEQAYGDALDAFDPQNFRPPDEQTLHDWVKYSVLDAQSTWELWKDLSEKLREMPLYTPGHGESTTH
jgi:hypothetical protein